MSETTYYAIGDIHGELEKLSRLYELIAEDAAKSDAPTMLVHLGDLIDRGPDSRGVVELVMAMHEATHCLTIQGNHEAMLLSAYDKPMGVSYWTGNGGEETLASYQRVNGETEDWRTTIDKSHINWMRQLPVLWRDDARKIVFVHGGIDPLHYPNCTDEVKLWTRSSHFFDTAQWPPRPELDGILVVHGHTPTENSRPDVRAQRINVDTGACFGGPLTCVVLSAGEAPRFLTSA